MKRLIIVIAAIVGSALALVWLLAPRPIHIVRIPIRSFTTTGTLRPDELVLSDGEAAEAEFRIERAARYTVFVTAQGKGRLAISVDGMLRQKAKLGGTERVLAAPVHFPLERGRHSVTLRTEEGEARIRSVAVSSFYDAIAADTAKYNSLILEHARASDCANLAIRAICYTNNDVSPRGIVSLCNVEAIAAEAFDRLRTALRELLSAHDDFLQGGSALRLQKRREQFGRILFETEAEVDRMNYEATETLRRLTGGIGSSAFHKSDLWQWGLLLDLTATATLPPVDVQGVSMLPVEFCLIRSSPQRDTSCFAGLLRKALPWTERPETDMGALFNAETSVTDEVVLRAVVEREIWRRFARGESMTIFTCGSGRWSLTDGKLRNLTLRFFSGVLPVMREKFSRLAETLRGAVELDEKTAATIFRCENEKVELHLKRNPAGKLLLFVINCDERLQNNVHILFPSKRFSVRDLTLGLHVPPKEFKGKRYVDIILHRGGGTVLELSEAG